MTILPGQAGTTGDPQSSPEPPRRVKPRMGRGAIAALTAAVVVLGIGGTWLALRSTGSTGSKPLHMAQPAHHVNASPATLPAPQSRSDAMRAATKVFAVLPGQLPGWRVSGTASFDNSQASDPVSRSINRCFSSANNSGITVDSPSLSRTTSEPTNISVDAGLTFVRSPARATADLAALRRPSALRCISAKVVGRTISIGHGATLRFDSMRRLRVPSGVVGMEFDGQLSSDVIGDQGMRVVMLAAVDRATEILVTSAGLGAALPLSTDVHILRAVQTQTRSVIG